MVTAIASLTVNILALTGGAAADWAFLLSFTCLGLFLILVVEELRSSIRHLVNREYEVYDTDSERPPSVDDWPSRIWTSLRRAPQPPALLRPLLIAGAILVVSWQVHQFQTDYLVQHAYSDAAINITAITTAPLWEEFDKVGIGILGGALFSATIVAGTRMGQKLGKARADLRDVWRRALFWTSIIAFIGWAVVRFAISESLGGGIDGRRAEVWEAALKLFGHPAFSLLAVLMVLEARPRSLLFLGLGFGLHSLVNLIITGLTGRVEFLIYSLTVLFIVVFNLRVLSRWYPAFPRTVLRALRRITRTE